MAEESVNVNMAEMEVVSDAGRLKAILGSCVGVILRDPDRRLSGLAHIMLPAQHRGDTVVGKYADTAIPALLARLLANGGRQSSLQALLVGGSQMFPMGNAKIASIGDQNVEASRRILHERCIPIVYEDTGGMAGRSVTYDNATGKVSVRTLRAIEGKEEAT
jgi:chemotaxis protein CheD